MAGHVPYTNVTTHHIYSEGTVLLGELSRA